MNMYSSTHVSYIDMANDNGCYSRSEEIANHTDSTKQVGDKNFCTKNMSKMPPFYQTREASLYQMSQMNIKKRITFYALHSNLTIC